MDMRNNAKKIKKNVVNFEERASILSNGNMSHAFKEYMKEEPGSSDRINRFMNVYCMRLKWFNENDHAYTENEIHGMLEFYDYFIKNYTNGSGLIEDSPICDNKNGLYVINEIESFLEEPVEPEEDWDDYFWEMYEKMMQH